MTAPHGASCANRGLRSGFDQEHGRVSRFARWHCAGGFGPGAVKCLGLGNEGHQIIALIAADRLTTAARAEVADLLGGDARPTMANASTWADYIRPARPESAPWHYVNIEITASGYNAATDCPAENCVVAQVEKDARIVADHKLAKPVRAEALRFLIHFAGDLHQPLHCADNHDRGGNEVSVLIGAQETNLHSVWDTDVVAALGQDPEHVASALGAQISSADEASWGRGSPVDWANESFRIAKHAIYRSLRGLESQRASTVGRSPPKRFAQAPGSMCSAPRSRALRGANRANGPSLKF